VPSRIRRRFLIPALMLLVTTASARASLAQGDSQLAGLASGAALQAEPMVRAADGRPTVRAFRVDAPLRIDGRLDEEIYAAIPAITDFLQQVPKNGEPATEKTEAWVLFDAKNLYVSARFHDTHPEREIADEMRRDASNIFQNENLTVVLDTFHDRRNGFFFQVNPLSAMRDQMITDEVQNQDWNTIVSVKSARSAEGWTTEISIPFKSLRYAGSGPQTWGINLRRVVRWKNEVSTIALLPAAYGLPAVARLTDAANLVGVETPASSMNLELKPYVLGTVTTDHAAAPFIDNDLKSHAGFDFKYGLTRSLIADVTYNTDFAQVEEDLAQVNLTRFNLQFAEKRDFFLEGRDLFAFGSASGDVPILFYSRQIGLKSGQPVPVVGGGRLTGKAGPFSIGALNIQTGDKASAGAVDTNFSVLRLKRDILRRSNAGAIFTRRSPGAVGGDANFVGGVDANLLLFRYVELNGSFAKTHTEGRSGPNTSYRGRFEYGADRYGLALEHLRVDPDFNPEIGFLRRTDFTRNFAQARFSPRPNTKRIRKITFEGTFDRVTNADRSQLEDRSVSGSVNFEFQTSDQWNSSYSRDYEFLPKDFTISRGVVVPAGAYSYQDVTTSYSLGQQHRVSGRVTLTHGSLYRGDRTQTSYSGRATITKQFALEPSITLAWVDLPFGTFTSRVVANRFVFMATPQLFVTSLVQYSSNRHALSSSVRLRWEYAPRSELFVVYSDGRDRTLDNQPEFLNRSLAVKVTRLLRF
jgi:hypothetical protein